MCSPGALLQRNEQAILEMIFRSSHPATCVKENMREKPSEAFRMKALNC